MSISACANEQRILEAASAGEWDSDLAAHLAQCEDCADLALVSGWLQATEEPRELAVDLEQASRIWRVADAEKRRDQAALALLPLAIGEFAACLFGCLALLVFAGRYMLSLLPASQAVALRLLADPVVLTLGVVVVALIAVVTLSSLALAVGMRATRS